jgi:hypothetical protein
MGFAWNVSAALKFKTNDSDNNRVTGGRINGEGGWIIKTT